MAKCETCKFDNVCDFSGTFRNNVRECRTYEQKEQQTWGNKIRSMSDEEMSTQLFPFLLEVFEDGVPTEEEFLKWLKSEVKE